MLGLWEYLFVLLKELNEVVKRNELHKLKFINLYYKENYHSNIRNCYFKNILTSIDCFK